MTADHQDTPKTIGEVGIVISNIQDDVREIKESIKNAPTRREFDELSKSVENKLPTSTAIAAGGVVTLLLTLLSFFADHIR